MFLCQQYVWSILMMFTSVLVAFLEQLLELGFYTVLYALLGYSSHGVSEYCSYIPPRSSLYSMYCLLLAFCKPFESIHLISLVIYQIRILYHWLLVLLMIQLIGQYVFHTIHISASPQTIGQFPMSLFY